MPEIAFGPYTLLERLAVGGMAEVYLARLGTRRVVVKQILPQLARDPDLLQLFLDEARVARELAHPGIVGVFDYGEHGGTHFLAMEYVDGLDLDELVKCADRDLERAGLPAEIAVEIALQLARAVDYAHEARDREGRSLEIIHRDISPQNVLIGRGGVVKLSDFGIARTRLRAVRTETGVLRGKLSYLAPERFLGEPATRGVDVYAMGVVLFEALSGRRPFVGDEAKLIQLVMSSAAPSLDRVVPDADPRLVQIVATAMARRVEDRFPSAGSMAEALAETRLGAGTEKLGAVVAELRRRRDARLVEARARNSSTPPKPPRASTETLPGASTERGSIVSGEVIPSPSFAGEDTLVHASGTSSIRAEAVDTQMALVLPTGDGPVVEAGPVGADPAVGESGESREDLGEARRVRRVAAVLVLGLVAGAVVSNFAGSTGEERAVAVAPTRVPGDAGGREPGLTVIVSASVAAQAPRPVEDPPALPPPERAPPGTVERPERPERAAPARPREGVRARDATRPRRTPAPVVETRRGKKGESVGFGELSIDSEPWAYVSLGGQSLGPTPLAHVRIPAGAHKLVLENPEAKLVRTVPVTIKPDERTVLRVRLSDGKLSRP